MTEPDAVDSIAENEKRLCLRELRNWWLSWPLNRDQQWARASLKLRTRKHLWIPRGYRAMSNNSIIRIRQSHHRPKLRQ